MIERRDYEIQGLPEGATITGIDFTPGERPIAAVRTSPDATVPSMIVDGRVVGLPEESQFKLPDRSFNPTLRVIDETRVVVVRPRCREGEINAWIVDNGGEVIRSFHAGDDADQVLANRDYILVFYNDEGQTGDVKLSRQAMNVWSAEGEYLWGHASQFKKNRPMDVWFHAAAWAQSGR